VPRSPRKSKPRRLASTHDSVGTVALEVEIMATALEPKTQQESQIQPALEAVSEPELFAAEIAMEGKNGNFLPLLLIAALVIVVGGTIFYL
jgi:hypothetical protein